MTSKKNVAVGIIGAGYWGPNLIRNFSLVDGCKIKYVCDLDKKKLEKLKKTYPSVTFTTKAQDVFSDKNVDVVAIATPVATHFALAKKALLSGKHVFIEKPITKSVAEAEELIKIANKKKLLLHVDHTFLYYPPILKIKEIIDSGELGDLHYFDSQRVNLGLIQPDINVIWDLAPHDISILQFLYNKKPKSVSATATRHVGKNKEELAHVSVEYATGFVAHLHLSWLSPVKLRQVLIGGAKKMIYFDDIHPSEKIKIYSKNIEFVKNIEEDTFNPVYRSGDVHLPVFSNEEALLKECEHFIDCLKKGVKTLTPGESGLDVVRILEAADKSLKARGKHIIL